MIDRRLVEAVHDQDSLLALLNTQEDEGGLGWPVAAEYAFEEVPEIAQGVRGDGKVSVHRLIRAGVEGERLILLAEFERPYLRRDLRELLRSLRAYARKSGFFEDHSGIGDTIFIVAAPDYEDLRFVLFEERDHRVPRIRSFGWRHEFVGRTVLTHNLEKLLWSIRTSWETAWDVESLTEKFYADYEVTFRSILGKVQGGESPDVRHAWTHLLFNRLLFIAFIQRLGWLKVPGQRPGAYLFDLYRAPKAPFQTFYGMLRAVFVELDTKDADPLKHKFKNVIGEIPYLNGGLFDRDDPLDRSDITLPDEAFAEIISEPHGLFARYNFTVTESTPLDQEVAVDPEMLGKIFERLIIAEERHATGTYYTPRPIVEFMVNEAIKGYLVGRGLEPAKAALLVDQDKVESEDVSFRPSELQDAMNWLFEVKAVDPACGSGAYLLMLLQRLFDLVDRLEVSRDKGRSEDQKHLYETKLRILERCVYGVDLSHTGVRLARLRMWLSLVVENRGQRPDPLPNFEYLIMQGDSLASPLFPKQQVVGYPEAEIQEYTRMKARFFHPENGKRPRREEMQAQRAKIAEVLEDQLASSGLRAHSPMPFDWEVDFAEVFDRESSENGGRPPGFDIVLANPPYVRQEEIRRSMGEHYKRALVAAYPATGGGSADLLVYFMDRALALLRPGGQFAFITSNKWLKAAYGKKLRCHLSATLKVSHLVDFGDLPVFQGTIAYPLITLGTKKEGDESVDIVPWCTRVASLADPYPDIPSVIAYAGGPLPEGSLGSDGTWFFETGEGARRLAQMRQRGVPLGEYVKGRVYYGIKTGLNEVKIGSDGRMYGKRVPTGVTVVRKEGVFVIDGAKRDALIAEDPKSEEIIKPLLIGRDIKRWRVDRQDRWLIVTKIGTDMSRYPAIMRHLRKYEALLRPRADQGDHWWELRACSYWQEFDKPKIVFPDLAVAPRFALLGPGSFTSDTTNLIVTGDHYLLAVLNSQCFMNKVISICPIAQNGFYRFKKVYLMGISIPDVSEEDRLHLESVIDLILTRGRDDLDADVCDLEAEIDARVEFLYFHRGERGTRTNDAGEEVPYPDTYDEWIALKEAEVGTAVAEIRALIEEGESGTVEFKQSLEYVDPSWFDNIPENHRSQRISEARIGVLHAALKTICAFANSKGGTLLLGVHDTQGIYGLDGDFALSGGKKDRDAFENKFTDLLKARIRPIPTNLDIRMVEVDGKWVCRVSVPSESAPHYLDNKLYIRLGNSTEELTGRDLQDWLERRARQAPEHPDPTSD